MTDFNSMKADEHAQRLGEMDEFDDAINDAMFYVIEELPDWVIISREVSICEMCEMEAKRRVMQAIKERSEPWLQPDFTSRRMMVLFRHLAM